MGTRVSALFESAGGKYGVRLHGGQAGLNNFASWAYLAEDVQNVSFLKGGELIITTGLFTLSGVTLMEFINALVPRGCSALLINVGKYLTADDIDGEIVTFCDRCEFPIFSMPWEVRLVDIMQDLCYLLMRNTQSENLFSGALGAALHQEPVQEGALRALSQYGFQPEAQYRVIAIQNLQTPARVTMPLNASGLKYHLFEHENLWIMVYALSKGQPSPSEIADMICYCDGVKVGIGDVSHALADIGQGYKRARFALAAASFWQRRAVLFEEMGLFQALFATSDPDLLHRISRKYLGALEEHDATHGTDYTPTLRAFLLSDCNILETANRIHIHRNTVVYRVKRIREILNTQLNNSEDKFNLLVAFYIKEYFSI